jgi:ubiquinone/menaquinone biosynthesis C-methylase UbiE
VHSFLNTHLDNVRDFYDSTESVINAPSRSYRKILAHYYSHIIPKEASILEVGCGGGDLLALLPNRDITGVDLSAPQIERARAQIPWGTFLQSSGEQLELHRKFDFIILSETINQSADVQALFTQLRKHAHPETRLVVNFYNSVWRPILRIAELLGLKAPQPVSNWLSTSDVLNLLSLSDWDPIKVQPRILLPLRIPILERLFNAYLAPLLPPVCLTIFITSRLWVKETTRPRSVSVVIPARNEAGTIEEAVLRTPEMGGGTELVFVEGHSTDNTWDEIQRVEQAYPQKNIRILRQSARGKGNAVRDGFSAATGEILMILDADLTVPPEDLPKFYDAIANGHAEFANGVRLVYPMREGAMQFANMCANKAFSLIFTFLLGQPVKDTLCGTKVLLKSNYDRIAANRSYFGDFDPFGDFDLLFGADKLNLKICDIPIRYQERIYGSTNIQRWRHGLILLRMVLFAARKLKFI